MSRIPLHIMISVIMLSGCAGEPASPGTGPAPRLAAETWYVHTLGGANVPTVVARLSAAGQGEETVVDSAQLQFADNGRYTLRSWTSVYRGLSVVARELWREGGTWAWSDSGFVLRSDAQELRGLIREASQPVRSLRLRVAAGLAPLEAVLRATNPPATPAGIWQAAAVRDVALPATVYVFDGVIEDGREISSHFIVDSARFELHPTGRYVHRIWYAEWEGAPGGPPRRIRLRYTHADFGSWRSAGVHLSTESAWIQNHRMSGTVVPDSGTLKMPHGLTPGDEPVPVRYARRQHAG